MNNSTAETRQNRPYGGSTRKVNVMNTDIDTLSSTRRALHGVAELVMAGPQYRASGTIRLAVTQGGFGTVASPALRVDGARLIVQDQTIPLTGTTFGELAAAAGVEAGRPEGLYDDGSGVPVDERVSVDSAAAAFLEECFARGQEALTRFAPDERPVLWPEHFDLAIVADEVNYGISPGDTYHAEPYAYAGPWQLRDGEFWNAPFGAARSLRSLPDAKAVHDFYAEARSRVGSDPLRKP